MPNYRRNRVEPGRWLLLFYYHPLERHENSLLVQHIDLLRDAVQRVRRKYSFHVDGWVILPGHMHCIWTLPAGDSDYSLIPR